MRESAVSHTTTDGGSTTARLLLLLVFSAALFFFMGSGVARAGLLGDVVEPIGGVVEELPVGDVVEAVPVEEVAAVVSPPSGDVESEPEQTEHPAPVGDAVGAVTEVAGTVAETAETVTEPVAKAPAQPPVGSPKAPTEPVAGVAEATIDVVVSSAGNMIQDVAEVADSLEVGEPGDAAILTEATGAITGTVRAVDEVIETASPVATGVGRALNDASSPVGTLLPPLANLVEQTSGLVLSSTEQVTTPVIDLVDETLVRLEGTVGGVTETVREVVSGVPLLPVDELVSDLDGIAGGDGPPVAPGDHPPRRAVGPPGEPATADVFVPQPSTVNPVATRGRGEPATGSPLILVDPDPSARPVGYSSQVARAPGSPQPEGGSTDGWGQILFGTLANSSGASSGYVFGFVAILSLLGLAAPRLSCWLRLQPVIMRRSALALAIERPG